MSFFWQLYGSIAVTAFFLAINIQSYVPENFGAQNHYSIFVISMIPGIVLLGIEAVVATYLLSIRTWDLLVLLRNVIAIELVVLLLSYAIDARYFPDNLAMDFMSLVFHFVWLLYLFHSVRVKHVFQAHDWHMAVESIYGTVLPKIT